MVTYNIDTFINIIKRRENIRYKNSISNGDVNILYVGNEGLSAEKNISVADRASSLAANRVVQHEYTVISNTKTFTSKTSNLAITDIYCNSTATIPPLPLFSKHILNLDRDSSGNISTGIRLVQVEVLDKNQTKINPTDIKIDYEKGIVYNNLISSYSQDDWAVYYIKYVVRDVSNEVNTYIDLLNNINTYQVAQFSDLDSTLHIKTDGRKVYLISESSNVYLIELPISNTYSYKATADRRIAILPSATNEVEDSWHVNISNGSFLTHVNSTLYKYYLAEFLSQSFSPVYPYKYSEEVSLMISSNLIKLDRKNFYADLFLSIEINDSDDNGIIAFTTDPTQDGVIATNGKPFIIWNNRDRIGIRSIDNKTGFVSIDGLELLDTWKINSKYYFEEVNYEFTAIELNPIINPDILKYRLVIFIDPDTQMLHKNKTIFYLLVNDAGRVEVSDLPNFNNSTQKYNTDNFLYYDSQPSWDTSTPAIIFTDSLSTSGTGNYLVLGDVTVTSSGSIPNLTTIDSRIRGGGIISNQIKSARAMQPDVGWYWDISTWDGIPYPGNASYLVEIPADIIQDTTFTSEQIRAIVNNHTALGTYALIRLYSTDITIDNIEQSSSTITINWTGIV